MKNSRIQKRVYELLCKAAGSRPANPDACQRELHFVFFRKPERFLESEKRKGHVAAVRFEKTTLKGAFSLYLLSMNYYKSDKPCLSFLFISIAWFCAMCALDEASIRYMVWSSSNLQNMHLTCCIFFFTLSLSDIVWSSSERQDMQVTCYVFPLSFGLGMVEYPTWILWKQKVSPVHVTQLLLSFSISNDIVMIHPISLCSGLR